MEFRRLLHAIVLLPAQIVRSGRRIIYRIMGYNSYLKDFLLSGKSCAGWPLVEAALFVSALDALVPKSANGLSTQSSAYATPKLLAQNITTLFNIVLILALGQCSSSEPSK